MKELIQKLKVMAGISSDDPPDTQWISLEKTDRKTGRKVCCPAIYRHGSLVMCCVVSWKFAS